MTETLNAHREHLKKWRENKGWTFQRMADELGVDQAYYWRVETGAIADLRTSTVELLKKVTRLPISKIEGNLKN